MFKSSIILQDKLLTVSQVKAHLSLCGGLENWPLMSVLILQIVETSIR